MSRDPDVNFVVLAMALGALLAAAILMFGRADHVHSTPALFALLGLAVCWITASVAN